jgi:hypothetical protein
MFRQFQRFITFSAALVICAAIYYLVSLFYAHIGAVATNIKTATKPKGGVVYVMTFKSSESSKHAPSQGQHWKPKSSNGQGKIPQ